MKTKPKHTYWTVTTVVSEGKAYEADESLSLTARQAANWLAAGKITDQQPTAKKTSKSTESK